MREISPEELVLLAKGKAFTIYNSDGSYFQLRSDGILVEVAVTFNTISCYVNEEEKPYEADGIEFLQYTFHGKEYYGYDLKEMFPKESFYIRKATPYEIVLSTPDNSISITIEPKLNVACCYDENYNEYCDDKYIIDAEVDTYFVYSIAQNEEGGGGEKKITV